MKILIDKIAQNHNATAEELEQILSDSSCDEYLFSIADQVRHDSVGDAIHIRGLIEFSNYCKNNCCYCGIRKGNGNLPRYHLSVDEIIALAEKAKNYGYQTVVLQSGEDLSFDMNKMEKIIKGIKALDLALTLSIGEKTFEEYKAYFDFGADRYLIRIETTDKDLYHELDPGMSWENRHRCLCDLKKIGYETGSGCMVGLPKQTLRSIANDILYFKSLPVDMCGIGPFIPHPDTPLKDAKGKKFILSLKTMALTRLLLPKINIPATTAMETLYENGRVKALQSGANVVMLNVSDSDDRQLYNLYPNKAGSTGNTITLKNDFLEKVRQIGRTISTTKGSARDN